MTGEQHPILDLGRRWAAVHAQRAAYRGRPNDGRFRATHIAVRDDGEWKLAGIHLSPIGVPAAPPQQPASDR